MTLFGSSTLLTNKSMATSFVSEKISLERKGGLAIIASYTGTPEGVLSLESSITGNESNNDDWKIVPDSHVRINFASQVLYNMSALAFPYIRLAYRFIDGTGAMDASFSTKEIA